MIGPDLKPCPFCGGAAEIVNIDDGENAGGSCVCCTRCVASGNVEFGRKENFVSNWNRRDPAVLAALPEVQAMIAAAYEVAANLLERHQDYGMVGTDGDYLAGEAEVLAHGHSLHYALCEISTLTPADATAALARIVREAEARGMVKGMREAATLLREQGYGTAPKQILARAAEIERDGK